MNATEKARLAGFLGRARVAIPDWNNPDEVKEKLDELEAVLKAQRKGLSQKPDFYWELPHTDGLGHTPEQEGFSAKLNPRRGRRNRSRRPRRGRARENPWSPAQVKYAERVLNSKSTAAEVSEAEKGLVGVFDSDRAALFEGGSDITSGVRALFGTRQPRKAMKAESRGAPDPYSERNFIPAERLRHLEHEGITGLIGSLSAPTAPEGVGRTFTAENFPWQGKEGALNYMSESFAPSLYETQQILAHQRASKKSSAAMQASSAVCKAHRSQRIDYMPGQALLSRLGNDPVEQAKAVLILMSPIGNPVDVGRPRVMTFKRGVHMDCDLTEMGGGQKGGTDMGRLTGLAIQSVLLWLAEKSSRKARGSVWLGRVGSEKLFRIWSGKGNNAAVSFKSVQDNLRKAQATQTLERSVVEVEEKNYKDSVRRHNQRLPRKYRTSLLAPESRAALAPDPPLDDELPPSPPEPKKTRTRKKKKKTGQAKEVEVEEVELGGAEAAAIAEAIAADAALLD
jgi:hypothetical protein